MPLFTATISADSEDASCRVFDVDWADVVAGTGTFEDRSGLTTAVVSRAFSDQYYNTVALFRFDLSAIPPNAAIAGAVLKLYVDSFLNTDEYSYGADFYDFGGGTTTIGDWEIQSSGVAVNAFDTSILTVSTVVELAIDNLDGLLPGGIIGIRIATQGTTAPLGDNYIRFAAHEHATGAPPALEVTYEKFPTLTTQDDFNRSNSTTVGSRWTETGTSGLQITSNQLAEESSDGAAFLNDILAADIEWYGEKGDASLNDRWLQWRAKNAARTGDPDSGWSGYQLRVGNDIVVERWSGAALTTVATIAVEIQDNEMVGVKHVGNNIKVMAKAPGELARVLGNTDGYTDSTYTDAGRLRTEFSSSLGRWEYVGGGSLDEAFPMYEHTLLSDFNGTDEDPISEGGKWASVSGWPTTAKRANNRLTGSSNNYWSARYTVEELSNFELIIPVEAANQIAETFLLDVCVRTRSEAGGVPTLTDRNGYIFLWNSDDQGEIIRANAGDNSETSLAFNSGYVVNPGDVFGLRVVGNVLKLYLDQYNTGEFTEILTELEDTNFTTGWLLIGGYGDTGDTEYDNITLGKPAVVVEAVTAVLVPPRFY
jgi:hypothetical protein